MFGSYDDIVQLEKNLAHRSVPVTLTAVMDSTVQTPGPIGVGENQSERWVRGWVKQHPDGKKGEILVRINAKVGNESGWLDPVDTAGSGLEDFISKHSG